MKKYIIMVMAVAALCVQAAEEPVSVFNAGEFSLEAFGGVVTPDLDDERTSYGFGVGYYLTQSLGARLRTTFENLSGHTFDNVTAHGLWRVPVGGKHAFYAFAGGTRVFHGDTEWSVEGGPGYAYRPIEWLEGFAEIGMRKAVTGTERDASALATVGVRLTF